MDLILPMPKGGGFTPLFGKDGSEGVTTKDVVRAGGNRGNPCPIWDGSRNAGKSTQRTSFANNSQVAAEQIRREYRSHGSSYRSATNQA